MRTSEIHAYNWGSEARRGGYNLPDLAPLGSFPQLVEMGPAELDAVGRLGPDEFHRWAVRGWSETPDPEPGR